MAEPAPSRMSTPARNWVIWLSLLVIAAAVALRVSINFAYRLPGGMDAAYYPMQTWWLLERGRLAYNDLPLIFVLGAALAKVLMVVGGMSIDTATMLASRLIDSVLPPLATVALVGMGWTWLPRSKRTRGTAFALAAAACVATLSLPIARMVGDFQKNSLGFIWMIAAVWAVRAALTRGGVSRWMALGAAVMLAALTHVAVLGATVMIVGIAIAVFVVRQREWTLRRSLVAATLCILVGGTLLGGVYLASPRRAIALATAPIKLFSGDGRRGPGPGPGMAMGMGMGMGMGERRNHAPTRDSAALPPPDDRRSNEPGLQVQSDRLDPGPQATNEDNFDGTLGTSDQVRPDRPDDMRRPGRPGRPGGPGGPGGGLRMESLVTYFAYPVALLAMWRLWRERAVISLGDASVMWGVIATVALLACPFLSGEYAHRLSLMAPVPTAMLCVFLCVRRSERGMAHWPSAIVALVALAPTAAALGWVPSPGPDARRSIAGMAILSDADAAEMEVVRTYIASPTKTLIVAPHGLEWWAGYYLKTAVAEGRPPDDAYLRYDFVYYLEQVRGRPGLDENAGPGPNRGPDGAFRQHGEPGWERPRGLQFQDIDVIYSGEHLRLFEYPIPGEDPEDD